jgi:hypothetical protein
VWRFLLLMGDEVRVLRFMRKNKVGRVSNRAKNESEEGKLHTIQKLFCHYAVARMSALVESHDSNPRANPKLSTMTASEFARGRMPARRPRMPCAIASVAPWRRRSTMTRRLTHVAGLFLLVLQSAACHSLHTAARGSLVPTTSTMTVVAEGVDRPIERILDGDNDDFYGGDIDNGTPSGGGGTPALNEGTTPGNPANETAGTTAGSMDPDAAIAANATITAGTAGNGVLGATAPALGTTNTTGATNSPFPNATAPSSTSLPWHPVNAPVTGEHGNSTNATSGNGNSTNATSGTGEASTNHTNTSPTTPTPTDTSHSAPIKPPEQHHAPPTRPPHHAPTSHPKPTSGHHHTAPPVNEESDPVQNENDDAIANEWTQEQPKGGGHHTGTIIDDFKGDHGNATVLGILENDEKEMMQDKYVPVVVLATLLVSFMFLLFVAQQMIENPHGCCGKLCRCIIGFLRILCCPCRTLCCSCCGSSRAKDRRTHELISDENGYGYSHGLELT